MTEPTPPVLPQSGGSWVRQPDGSLIPVPSDEVQDQKPEKPTPRGKTAVPEKE